MRPRLVVHLTDAFDQPFAWTALGVEGDVEAQGGSLSELPDWLISRPATGLASARAVLLTQVAIPTRRSKRIRQALPFALEDQLSQDVDELHFAPGSVDNNGQITAAVIDRELMAHWLLRAEEAGVDLVQIYPEPLALPPSADSWSVLVHDDGCLVKTSHDHGFGSDLDNLGAMLQIALRDSADNPPVSLTVYHPPGQPVPELPEQAPPADFIPIEERRAFLARELKLPTPCPLRVGAFAPEDSAGVQWHRFAVPTALAGGVLLLATLNMGIEHQQLAGRIDTERQSLAENFREAFPNSDIPPGQMPSVMRTRLERAMGDSGADRGFLRLVQSVAPVLADASDVETGALSYRRSALNIEVKAPSLQAVDRLKQRLSKVSGVEVKLGEATSGGDRAQARFVIRGESA